MSKLLSLSCGQAQGCHATPVGAAPPPALSALPVLDCGQARELMVRPGGIFDRKGGPEIQEESDR